MSKTRLAGKTALVTGAAKRIGRATALALARKGVNVVVHYNTSGDEAESLARELATTGVKSWTIKADFSVRAEYESLIERSMDAAGALDILVNNASIFPTNSLADVTLESLYENIEINAWTPFFLSRDFARLVGRGCIVNLIDSRVSGYDWAHVGYIISKHALAVFSRMTALDYAPDIRVNGVDPGLILPPPGKDESYLDRLKDTVPLKRHGDPEDVASAVIFLLENDFLTGEVISVDGGRHLKDG